MATANANLNDNSAAIAPPAATSTPAQTPISPAATGEDELSPYRWIILVGLITAAILEVLDTTIVNVALPQMAGNLGATSQEIGWVSTGYILSNVIILPMTAWLSSRFGRKRYLAGSIILFLVASFFCGTSRELNELVFWRILQGAGGAALLSTAQSTIREIFPKEQQGLVQSLYVLGIITAPTLGPTLGGWITDNYSWPWIFFVNLPIGIFSLFIVTSFLEDAKFKVVTKSVDWWGVGLLAAGLGSLQYVLEEGNQDDWFESAAILRLTIIGTVSILAFLWWELSPKNPQPIVNLRVLKNRDLSAALILFMALGFGLYGGIFIFPLFAQNILHFTPTTTGLVLMPGAIATGFSAMMSGRILNNPNSKITPRMMIIFGMILFVYSMWDLGHLTTMSGEPDTRLALIIRGFGLGCLFTPINLAAFSSLQGVEIAQGASLLNLMRQLGGSFGIAYLGTHITNSTAAGVSNLTGYLYPGNPAFNERLQTLQAAMQGRGYDAGTAHTLALAIIQNTVHTQAQVIAYDSAFLFIGLAVVLVSPCVFLLRSNKAVAASSAEMGHETPRRHA